MKQQLMFHYDGTNDTRWRNVAVGPVNAPGAKDSAERDGVEIHGGRKWLQVSGPNSNFIRKLIGIFVYIYTYQDYLELDAQDFVRYQ
jgi:hypothetical protein